MRQMPLVYNNPDHWRSRALEARAMADRMPDDEGKIRMLAIAEQYERISERAVQRLKAKAMGRAPIVSD